MNPLREKIINILKNEKGDLCNRSGELDPTLTANEILIAVADWLASDEQDQAVVDAEENFNKFAVQYKMDDDNLLRACAINTSIAARLNLP